jgi:hypothetical protein
MINNHRNEAVQETRVLNCNLYLDGSGLLLLCHTAIVIETIINDVL